MRDACANSSPAAPASHSSRLPHGHQGRQFSDCGQLTFFTRETCRQLTLDPALTHAFDPVAKWLERVAPLHGIQSQ